MSKLLFALVALATYGATVAEEPHAATDIAVFQRDACGALFGVGDELTHCEPVRFSRQFSYLVGTDRPTDTYDGHWSMTISNLRYDRSGAAAFDVSMEGKDPGVYEGKANTHVLVEQGTDTGVVRGIDGKDYLIKLPHVSG